MKKSVRKILRQVKRNIRYSKRPETEADLLIYFCNRMAKLRPNYKGSRILLNMYASQLRLAKKAINKLHEDLQYDFNLEIDKLNN